MLALLLSFGQAVDAQDRPFFEEDVCPFYVPLTFEVDCGYLSVPENRQDPDSPMIQLAVAIIRGESPAPEPIIYLEGGPGGSALTGFYYWLESPFTPDYDVILFDQRGIGYSTPRLECPIPGEDTTYEEDAEICRELLEDEGIDLAMYTSANSAADIEDLRIALGYDQINLFGVSYGTRLALTYMRDFPDAIRSVILDSAYPPQVNGYEEQPINALSAFQALFNGCADDQACNAAFPDLENVFYQLVDSANQTPLVNEEEELEWTGDDLVNILFDSMYDTELIPYLPALIYKASKGDTALLVDLEYGELGEGWDYAYYPGPEDPEALDALYYELLADYLDLDDADAAYDYLLDLDEDEFYDTLDDFFDNMEDADFAELMILYFNFEDEDALNDTIDQMNDAQYEVFEDEFYNYFYQDAEDYDSNEGMYNSVECYEEIPFNDFDVAERNITQLPDAIESGIYGPTMGQFEACRAWGIPAAPSFETEIVRSDAFTLITAGEYDPITPPSWSLAAAEGLSRHYFVQYPRAGHGVALIHACATEITLAFLRDPMREPDQSCLERLDPLDFYTGG
jgi:pimeloyl-ACP methyl ester carboxylesterase